MEINHSREDQVGMYVSVCVNCGGHNFCAALRCFLLILMCDEYVPTYLGMIAMQHGGPSAVWDDGG